MQTLQPDEALEFTDAYLEGRIKAGIDITIDENSCATGKVRHDTKIVLPEQCPFESGTEPAEKPGITGVMEPIFVEISSTLIRAVASIVRAFDKQSMIGL